MTVTNSAISNLTNDAQIVITQNELTPRAKSKLPDAYHISVDNFLSSPEYDKLIDQLQNGVTKEQTELVEETVAEVTDVDHNQDDDDLLREENIFLNQEFATKEEAIRFAGEVLVKAGYVEESYVDAMIDREKLTSTYMGNNVAIPHGTEEAKKAVLRSGFTVIQVPNGVDFDGQEAKLIFGIAGKDGTHLDILSGIAIVCSDEKNVEQMVQAKTAKELLTIINSK